MVYYLGKLTDCKNRTLFFSAAGNVVVECRRSEAGSIVQAFKRMALAEANLKKDLPLDQILTILSAFNASVDVASEGPKADWVRKMQPLNDRKRRVTEEALRKVEAELGRQQDDYLDWRGVRDLDEAHYNLKKRSEEIFDLNQKLYHNSREPQFIYNPGHPLKTTLSAWQSVGRIHLRELKDQAKERASAVRLRIDFTRRQRIKDLKDKRKDLLEELDREKKAAKDHDKAILRTVDESRAVSLAITVRSKRVEVRGRKDATIRECADEVLESARRLARTLKESLGLEFRDLPAWENSLSVPGAPKALVDAEALEGQLGQMIEQAVGRAPRAAELPVLRFPVFDAAKRFAYLGLALREDLSRTTYPILFDLDEQGPRHTAVVGGSGSGKSVAAGLIVEGAATHKIPAIIFDPTGSWTGFGEPCRSNGLLDTYPRFGMEQGEARSFDLKVISPEGAQYEPDVLSETIQGSAISVFASEGMTSAQEAEFASALLQDLLDRMKGWPESKALRLLLVFEEAHRYLGETNLEPILELFARTARARGVGLLIVSQVAVDLPPAIRNNCATKIQLSTNYAGDLSRAAQVFGSEFKKLIPKFPKGVGAVLYPEYGSATCAFRPPRHSPAGLSPSLFRFFQSSQELARLVATLTRQSATSDTPAVEDADSWENTAGQAPSGEKANATKNVATPAATDWRDVATRFVSTRTSALKIAKAIEAVGVKPPSLRTLQRFQRSHAHPFDAQA